jgi:adenine phosphoribosyltransferase
MNLLDYLPAVPDFPKPGIIFRDISPLLENAAAFQEAIVQLHQLTKDLDYTHILGIESRGFIFGSALAFHANKGLILARKAHKLPLATYQASYGLEYGSDSLEIQQSIIPSHAKVLLLDDVLATGGTLLAAAQLVRKTEAMICSALTLLEITLLEGSKKLSENHLQHQSLLKI